MIIDNGRTVHLVIRGVYDGRAGLSDGKLAFRLSGRPALANVASALVDGKEVEISVPTYSARTGFYEAVIHG